MSMRDIDIARRRLKENNLSLVIVKGGKVIFESRLHGLTGLIQAIDSLGEHLPSSSVADKIVGRAAALLLIYSHVSDVYATTISLDGLNLLIEGGIRVEYDNLVSRIMNRQGNDICPFEKISLTISSPEEAYITIKRLIDAL